MTTIKTFISTVALLAASTVFAQSVSTSSWFPKGEESGQGIIGKRYARASFGVVDVGGFSENSYSTDIGARIPIANGIDFTGGYSYSWFNPAPVNSKMHSIDSSVTVYNAIKDGVKPFISAGLGYSWIKQDLDSGWYFASNGKNSISHDYATWGVSVGAEFAYKWVAVIPAISFHDDFQRSERSVQEWTYGVEVNSWVTSKVGVYVSVDCVDQLHYSPTSFAFGAGVRVRF